MKVVIDRDLCIGAASCVALLPEVFALDGEGKAIVLTAAQKDIEAKKFSVEQLLEAAKSCPVNAITVFDDEGKQLYP